MAQITVNGLALGYEGNTVAENINFTVEPGDYLCIVGENGSGKSTLMKTLLGLEMPIRGEISFGDGLTQKDVGYLPQQTPVQRDFPASVKEIVLSGCIGKMKGAFYGAVQKEKAAAAMGKMGISHLASRCYRELSGGQQQRVLLARALCAAGKILLLDEPTAGLDPKVTAEMYELIYDLNRKDKITVIMISHDIDAARRYAGKILHIGSSVFFGSTEEYIKSDMGKRFTGGEKNDR